MIVLKNCLQWPPVIVNDLSFGWLDSDPLTVK